MRQLSYLFLLLLPVSFALQAQPQAEVPPPPAMNEETEVVDQRHMDEDFQPEVQIIQRGDDIIEEFRVQGQLYMVRITPAKGRPYYLIDSDGNGILDTRREALESPSVVKWRIFSW